MAKIVDFTQILAKDSPNGEGMTHVEVELSIGDSVVFSDRALVETEERPGRIRVERVSEDLFVIDLVTVK